MFAESPLLSLISRTAAKTEFVELTSSVITPYLALMWSILTETQNKKMKENKKTTNSPRLRTILDCNFFSWDWFGIDPFLIFLKTILTRWRISLCQYCCFSDRLHRLYLVGRPYLCKSSALALILSAIFAQCTDQSFGIEFARSLRRHPLSWLLNFAPEVN